MANFDYPEIPPGVQSFDARRFRRHYRKQFAASEISRMKEEKRVAEAEKKALLKALHNEQRKAREAGEERGRVKGQGVVGKVKAGLGRVFSRRSQQG